MKPPFQSDHIPLVIQRQSGLMLQDKWKNAYFLNKQKSKGKQIKYSTLKMAEYLHPNIDLTISQKLKMFSIRSHMVQIKSNFTKEKIPCAMEGCDKIENMEHIYQCEKLCNCDVIKKPPYVSIYSENISKSIEVLKIMEEHLEKYPSQENQF